MGSTKEALVSEWLRGHGGTVARLGRSWLGARSYQEGCHRQATNCDVGILLVNRMMEIKMGSDSDDGFRE